MIKIIAAPLLLFAVAAPVPAPDMGPMPVDMPAPEPQAGIKKHLADKRFSTFAYDPTKNGMEQLDFALAGAKTMRRNLVVILGANWCHDSAALANDIDAPPLLELFSKSYQVVYIDVGKPKVKGKGRNLDVPKRFGIEKLAGTPTVLILTPDGKMLNDADDAKSWRNAASRKPEDNLKYFTRFAR
jgi:hypothetical protein